MNHAGDLLSAYLDGELGRDDHAAVAAHLGTCGECRRELAAVSEARSSLRSLPVANAPEDLFAVAAPRRPPGRRRVHRAWIWTVAAAAAAVLAVGLAWGPGSAPPAMDLDHLAERHTARVVVQPGVQTVRAVLGAP